MGREDHDSYADDDHRISDRLERDFEREPRPRTSYRLIPKPQLAGVIQPPVKVGGSR